MHMLWHNLEKVCEKFRKFLKYVESTILDLLKEKKLRTWIDCVLLLETQPTKQS